MDSSCYPTLLDLIQAVSEVAVSDHETSRQAWDGGDGRGCVDRGPRAER